MREIVIKIAIVLVASLAAVPAVAQPSSSEKEFRPSLVMSPSDPVRHLSLPWPPREDRAALLGRPDFGRPDFIPLSTIGVPPTPANSIGRLRLAVVACLAQMPPGVAERIFGSERIEERAASRPEEQEEDESDNSVTCAGEQATVTITPSSIQACVTNGRCEGTWDGKGIEIVTEGTTCVTLDLEPS